MSARLRHGRCYTMGEVPMRRLLVLVCAAGCVDLPEGWQGADRVADFDQSACDGSPYDSDTPEPTVTVSAGGDELTVAAEPVTFRCAQDVEAFWKQDGDAVSVLVQPVDMKPREVAGCDCLYRVRATVAAPGAGQVTLWQRWDALNEPNEPVEVGAAVVE